VQHADLHQELGNRQPMLLADLLDAVFDAVRRG